MRRMGLVKLHPVDRHVMAKTMVIGATGSIGSVSARLLAMAFDEVVIAGRDLRKLEDLKASILKDTPNAKVTCSTDYDELLGEMDMIVTSTSGAGKKILDIMRVKPGCVITDVARPLDLPPEEVAKRPDVLVIESGEIELPTKVRGLKSIGLPSNVIYACLAETIVLALEGRFEVFTVGRDTEWEKVKEIYRLGIRHGMKLAAISGAKGVYSDEDIARVVELAKKARRGWKGGAAKAATVAAAEGAKPARKRAARPRAEAEVVATEAPPVTAPAVAPAPKAAKKVPAKKAPAKKAGAKTAAAKTAVASKVAADVVAVKAVAAKRVRTKAAARREAAPASPEAVAEPGSAA
jgi:hypothetical protein